ncbi:hypothetical protein [Actinophytocola sp.]|uniref:hypothetical protein n=1 Tax=Actinophytocola sp. TaxID=1872138 RepID=UPI002D40A66D|nr:hypothetical protein [Actinophytocola sp.]HYQ61827.1 hypothetical protein [Actinophytocola sp.]
MPVTFELLGAALMVVSVVVLGLGAVRASRRARPNPVLAPTILCAFGLSLLSVGWLIGPGVPSAASEAIRTGALASAAVLGLYALWLNDQRRRTEQDRLETERQRGRIEQNRLTKELDQLGMERIRIVDERFTKAIELLGHASDRVRIGALILLDGLTRTRPALIPDVLDQICGYLRGPVDEGASTSIEVEQERRVRQRAQRVLTTVLRRAPEPVAEIDLTGAALHEFRVDGGTVDVLRLDRTSLTGTTTLQGLLVEELTMKNCTTTDDVLLERDSRVDRLVVSGKDTHLGGRLICRCDLGTVDIESVTFTDTVELDGLTVAGHFAAHSDFQRLTVTHVTFAAGHSPDDTSIDLFQCTFAGAVLFDEVEVHGATRLAGIQFNDGVDLGARFHDVVTIEEALVAVGTEARLPAGWRLADHCPSHRQLLAPTRQAGETAGR